MAIDSGAALGTKFPANPTKIDNFFLGWYDGTTRYTAQTPIRKNVVLVAKFEEIDAEPDYFIDERDGQGYNTVKLTSQVTWMAENMKYEVGNSWCYGDDAANCDKYGKLYDWNSAKKACPAGWRLPDTADWNNLITAAGGSNVAGKKLKATSGWGTNSSYNGTDDYGFTALPGGYRIDNGTFRESGSNGYWWATTEYSSGAFFAYAYGSSSTMEAGANNNNKTTGYSVRCVQGPNPVTIQPSPQKALAKKPPQQQSGKK